MGSSGHICGQSAGHTIVMTKGSITLVALVNTRCVCSLWLEVQLIGHLTILICELKIEQNYNEKSKNLWKYNNARLHSFPPIFRTLLILKYDKNKQLKHIYRHNIC